jgi:hypothetical protein
MKSTSHSLAQDVCENAVKLLSARTRAARPPTTHNVRSHGPKIPQTKSRLNAAFSLG